MQFKMLTIKNFRNFKKTQVELNNKNIFFGLNDVGKTNFLYALRFLLDNEVRRKGFVESDFNDRDTSKNIELLLEIDISNNDSNDSKKLRAYVGKLLRTGENIVYIKLVCEPVEGQLTYYPEIYWGGNPVSLVKMVQTKYSFQIDSLFNVVTIDSNNDLEKLFKNNIKELVKENVKEDEKIKNDIAKSITRINDNVAKLSGVRDFETKIEPKFYKYNKDKLEIKVKSDVAIRGIYSSMIPYIKAEGSDKLYPTSGDGRKKLLSYAIFDLLAENNKQDKINLFLIEEPENHLHKSLQVSLSKFIFGSSNKKYLFMTTHSPYVLYEMDNVNLVRIYRDKEIITNNNLFKVPVEYQKNKKILNKELTEAIFSEKVLLVEGPSEVLLFEKIMSIMNPDYEVEGKYICSVGGVGFLTYFNILTDLKIETLIRTDNDLRSNGDGTYQRLGFNRVNKYIPKNDHLCTDRLQINSSDEKQKIYNDNIDLIKRIQEKHLIFLSKVDLEYDLYEAIKEKMETHLGNEPVKYLSASKKIHMFELIGELNDKDCSTIFNHDNFSCLRVLDK